MRSASGMAGRYRRACDLGGVAPAVESCGLVKTHVRLSRHLVAYCPCLCNAQARFSVTTSNMLSDLSRVKSQQGPTLGVRSAWEMLEATALRLPTTLSENCGCRVQQVMDPHGMRINSRVFCLTTP